MDNLKDELAHERAKQSSVNKKSLTLSVFNKILYNEKANQELVALFENKDITLNEEIREFLNRVAPLMHEPFSKEAENLASADFLPPSDLPVRTYVIFTHIYLELNHNELHYETLIRDTTALKEFITATFKAQKLSARIADIKSFSYKKILAAKNNDGARGQLKPQLKQIVSNPFIFGKEVSAFAADILKSYFE